MLNSGMKYFVFDYKMLSIYLILESLNVSLCCSYKMTCIKPSSDVVVLSFRTKLQLGSVKARQKHNYALDVVPELHQIKDLITEATKNSPRYLPHKNNPAKVHKVNSLLTDTLCWSRPFFSHFTVTKPLPSYKTDISLRRTKDTLKTFKTVNGHVKLCF